MGSNPKLGEIIIFSNAKVRSRIPIHVDSDIKKSEVVRYLMSYYNFLPEDVAALV